MQKTMKDTVATHSRPCEATGERALTNGGDGGRDKVKGGHPLPRLARAGDVVAQGACQVDFHMRPGRICAVKHTLPLKSCSNSTEKYCKDDY